MRNTVNALILTTLISVSVAAGDDWPHWRGPNRNGITNESSRFDDGSWNDLKPAWTVEVGEGSSSPLVVGDRVYVAGWQSGSDHVLCLSVLDGNTVWKQSYAAARYGRLATGDQGLFSGMSSTPEFDAESGFLFTLGADGDLNCWDTTKQGDQVWKRNLYDDYDVPRRPKVGRSGLRDYGYTSSPLVLGDQLLVEVGATQGNLIAFDKRTGQQLWTSQATSSAGHNGGPVPITIDGHLCVAVHNHDGLLVVHAEGNRAGESVASVPWVTEFANNIATVAVDGSHATITSAYNHVKIARYQISLNGAELVWEQPFASKVSSPVIHDGHVYWAWQQVICLEASTGALKWKGGNVGDPGSCIMTSDKRLIVWGRNGDLSLVESAHRSPDRYQELASLKRVGRSDAWPHVVLANGSLLCRDRNGRLVCFALGR